jgi:hypothetical protein
VFCVVSTNLIDHGSHRGDVAWALARWRHLVVASHEASNALHRAMRIALYCPIGMATKIVVNFPAFFVNVDSMFAHNVS